MLIQEVWLPLAGLGDSTQSVVCPKPGEPSSMMILNQTSSTDEEEESFEEAHEASRY